MVHSISVERDYGKGGPKREVGRKGEERKRKRKRKRIGKERKPGTWHLWFRSGLPRVPAGLFAVFTGGPLFVAARGCLPGKSPPTASAAIHRYIDVPPIFLLLVERPERGPELEPCEEAT